MSNPLDELMKQAQKLQDKMGQTKGEMQLKRFIGEAGAGLVKVTVNGQRHAVGVDIDASILSEDKQVLEDLLLTAINNALNKAEDSSSFTLAEIASKLNLEDILNPLKK